MARFGHFGLSQSERIQEMFKIQMSFPDPLLDGDFLYNMKDFVARSRALAGRLSITTGEDVHHRDNIPEAFVEKVNSPDKKESISAYPDLYARFACLRLTDDTDIDNDDLTEKVEETVLALKKRFGLAACRLSTSHAEDNEKGEKGTVANVYLMCLAGKIREAHPREKDQERSWEQEFNPKAASQFFAMLLAQGWVTEDILRNNGAMLGVQGIEILSTAQKLKSEGIVPIFQEPFRSSGDVKLVGR